MWCKLGWTQSIWSVNQLIRLFKCLFCTIYFSAFWEWIVLKKKLPRKKEVKYILKKHYKNKVGLETCYQTDTCKHDCLPMKLIIKYIARNLLHVCLPVQSFYSTCRNILQKWISYAKTFKD